MRLSLLTLVFSALIVAGCESTPDTTADQNAQTQGASAAPSQQVQAIPGSQEDLEVSVGPRVFFDFDSSTLRSDAQATAQNLAAWLKANPNKRIRIEGNADERGTREYNLALGDRRAESVRSFLSALGIDGGRLATISYGKERPIRLGSTPEAWAMNRNATFVVLN